MVTVCSRKYPLFDAVVGLVWSNDPKSYAGGSISIGRASYARQKGIPSSSRLRVGRVADYSTLSNIFVTKLLPNPLNENQKFTKILVKEYAFGWWNRGNGEGLQRIQMPRGRGWKTPRPELGCSAIKNEEMISPMFVAHLNLLQLLSHTDTHQFRWRQHLPLLLRASRSPKQDAVSHLVTTFFRSTDRFDRCLFVLLLMRYAKSDLEEKRVTWGLQTPQADGQW